MTDNDHLRLALKEKIVEQGYTLHSVAEASCVPVTTLQRFLAGSTLNPGLWHIVAICKVLGCSLDELCGIKQTSTDSHDLIDGYRSAVKAWDRVEHLHTRVNRRLWILLCCVLILRIDVLIFDALSPTIGYIKR